MRVSGEPPPVTPARGAAALLSLTILVGPMMERTSAAAGLIEEPVYIPAGVIDAGGTVACVRTPEGGVEAVDPATGRSLWHAGAPARALVLTRDRAFVLEERAGTRLHLAAYAARAGRLVRSYDLAALALPAWASLMPKGDGRQWTVFGVEARLAGESIEVHYEAVRMQAYGFRMPDVVDRVQGAAVIGLESGRVALRPGPGPAAPPIAEPAPTMPGVRLVGIHARVPDATLVLGGPPPDVKGALVAGDRRYAFELSPDTKAVTVHRWSVAEPARVSRLRLEHAHTTDAVWATIDRRHVLLRRADEQSRYDLYSLETGAPLGRLERPVDVAVVGPRAYWTTFAQDGSLLLVATRTGSRRRLWERTVREPEPPPGPPIP